ncbi:MAG TPA: tRNA (adenosine(37)-N6)-dimethylallyltransferase MiaA [Candidatus Azoamicus sp. OHIO1]
MFDNKVILFLMGPTCVGKSFLSIELFRRCSINIINMDSSMIYRYMNIGTSKPTNDELALFKHYLIDIKDPVEFYSVGDFCRDAVSIINICLLEKKIPCFVGGTMMYSWYLQHGLFSIPKVDPDIRNIMSHFCDLYGLSFLYDKLRFVNPVLAKNIGYNDKQRVIRALEMSYSVLNNKHDNDYLKLNYFANNWKIINIGIVPFSKFDLCDRIEKRFDLMLKLGFIDEVRNLYNRGDLNSKMSSVRSIGYKQIWNYLENKISFSDLRNQSIKDTICLVKRQLTWLKKWKNKIYYIFDNDSNIINTIMKLLTR